MIERRRMTRTVEAPCLLPNNGPPRLPPGLVVTIRHADGLKSVAVEALNWAWCWRDDVDPTHPMAVFGAWVLDASEPCGKEGAP